MNTILFWSYGLLIESYILWFFWLINIFLLAVYLFEIVFLIYFRNKYTRSSDFLLALNPEQQFFVFIPMRNEEKVIEKTLRSLTQSKEGNITFIVVDDASEDFSRKIVQDFMKTDQRVKMLERNFPNAQKGKGEALNHAYSLINRLAKEKGLNREDVVIGIIDSDTTVSESYFRQIKSVFANEKVSALQTRVRVLNDKKKKMSMLIAQDIEFAEIINSTQNFRSKNNVAAFGGNGQFMRLSLFEEKDNKPFSKSLVEDFELYLRLMTKGKQGFYQFSDIETYQTGVEKFGNIIRQRARWAQGNLQCLKYLGQIFFSKTPFLVKMELSLHIVKSLIFTFEMFLFIYMLLRVAFIGFSALDTIPFGTFALLFGIMTANYVYWSTIYHKHNTLRPVYSKRMAFIGPIVNTALLLLFEILVNISLLFAVYRYVTHKDSWVKTPRE